MDSIPPLKRCSKCGEDRPVDQFSKSKQHRDGLYPWCRACRAAYQRLPRSREYKRAYKQRPEVQAQRREYDRRPEVQARKREHWAKWAAKPEAREQMRARQRENWHNQPELRERKRQSLSKRYHENPEHKRKQIAHSMAAIHRRRARKQANGGSYTAKEWRELCEKYNHHCLCCGEAKPLTPDHVVPIAKCGSNDISNIQPLCLDCNLRKATKTIDYRPA